MALSKRVKIKYEVDGASAKRGLDAMAKGTEKVRKSTKAATDQYKAFDRAVERSNKNSAQVASILKDANGASGGLTSTLGGLSSAMGGPAGIAAAAAGAGVAISALKDKTVELAQRSLEVSAVFANVPIPIEAARRSTRGLVTDFDLARLASDAVSLGITDNAKDFGELSRSLQALGSRRGVGALKSIEDGFSAIGRGSTELLDNLGVTLKAAQAQDEYAASLGKAAKELTASEKAEAFRVVATRKVIEAAKGVTVTTDGAAAAVARFNVELQNIEDQALGGSAATLSLAEGLRSVAADGAIDIQGLKTYGINVAELRNELRDLGVAATDIPNSLQDISTAAQRANVEVSRLQGLEDLRRQREEADPAFQRARQRAEIEAQNLVTAKARLLEIEEEQAFLSANNKAIEQKADLQVEALKLQALIARAAGEEAKALQFSRQAELALLQGLSRQANPVRRRGRKRDPNKAERLVFQQQLTEALNAERAREFAGAASLQRNYLRDVQAFESGLQSVRLAGVSRSREAAAEEERLAGLRESRLQRDTELALAKAETDAQRFVIEQSTFDARETALQRQIQLETEVGERQQLEDDLAQVRHERTLSRIDRERQAREEHAASVRTAVDSVAAAERGAFQLSGTIASAAIAGEERRLKVTNGLKAAGLYADGAVAAANSVIAFASGNIPQGIALAAGAANAFAQGTVVAAGRAGPGGGGGSAGSATQFGGGQQAAPTAQFTVDRGAPISVRDEVDGNPNNTTSSRSGGQRGNVVNIARIDVLGAIDDETGNKIRKGLQRSEANLG